jgi:hypothetical protein
MVRAQIEGEGEEAKKRDEEDETATGRKMHVRPTQEGEEKMCQKKKLLVCRDLRLILKIEIDYTAHDDKGSQRSTFLCFFLS